MPKKKRKLHLSRAERLRRRAVALKNFGHIKRHVSRRSKGLRKITRSIPMVKRHRKSAHRRSSRGRGGFGGMLGGLNIMDLALMGAGAGLAGVAGAQVNKMTGGKLSGNTAQAAAGVGLLFAGKFLHAQKYTTPLAKGILIKTIGDYVEDNVAPKLMAMAGQTPTTSTVSSGELF